MKRGDIIVAQGRGDISNKPRPGLVVQADLFAEFHPAITICPITSEQTGDYLYRISIPADTQTNLHVDSEVEIDLVQAVRRERIARRIGVASEDTMILVDQALRRWLAL